MSISMILFHNLIWKQPILTFQLNISNSVIWNNSIDKLILFCYDVCLEAFAVQEQSLHVGQHGD